MRFSFLRPFVSAGRSDYSRLFLVAFLFCAGTGQAIQRPVPDDVAIRVFAKPSGDKLQFLVRVPFPALNGIEFPLRGDEGYLDPAQFGSILPGAARYWVASSIDLYENGRLLPKPAVVQTRAAVPSDKSFRSFDEALAHLNGPKLAASTNLFWNQAWLDILFEYPIHSDRDAFSIAPKFAHLGARVITNLTFLPPSGAVRAFTFSGDPGLVKLEPQWTDVAGQFFNLGFFQLVNGTDYLLFLFCLILPFRTLRSALTLAAAFALAHSVTLFASALNQAPDGLWFPPLIETAIAVTILLLALENIAGGITLYRRALAALAFGLIYGFSFAFGLGSKAQFAGTWPLVSAISFNLGLELALLVVLAVMLSALALLLRFTSARRIETIVLSVLAAHTAWHWMVERGERLSRFRMRWPAIDAALLSSAMRWMMILVILAGIAWFASGMFHRNRKGSEA